VLTCLSAVLKAAVEWKRIPAMPCTIKLVKVDRQRMPEFYEEEDFERLVSAATLVGHSEQVVVLLGGDAGLRKGEIIALEWDDLDLVRGAIVVRRAEYRGVVGLPKGGDTRIVPMTARLALVLKRFRHLRGPRLLYRADGKTVTEEWVRGAIKRAEKKAGLPVTKGKCHKLRHTFCTRLAMAGQPPRTIQSLAGHVNIETTMRYMHVAKAAPAQAIAALDQRIHGGGVEAQGSASRNERDEA
jgi:integrase